MVKKIKKGKKTNKKQLKKKTIEDMKDVRLEDSINLRIKSKELSIKIQSDIDFILKTKKKLKEQLFNLNSKELKLEGALDILSILLEE